MDIYTQYVEMLQEGRDVKYTRYFDEQVLRKRTYIKKEWCERAISRPVKKEIQENGRIRHWIFIDEIGKYLRVVALSDGVAVHNAFSEREFRFTRNRGRDCFRF